MLADHGTGGGVGVVDGVGTVPPVWEAGAADGATVDSAAAFAIACGAKRSCCSVYTLFVAFT